MWFRKSTMFWTFLRRFRLCNGDMFMKSLPSMGEEDKVVITFWTNLWCRILNFFREVGGCGWRVWKLWKREKNVVFSSSLTSNRDEKLKLEFFRKIEVWLRFWRPHSYVSVITIIRGTLVKKQLDGGILMLSNIINPEIPFRVIWQFDWDYHFRFPQDLERLYWLSRPSDNSDSSIIIFTGNQSWRVWLWLCPASFRNWGEPHFISGL